MERNLEIFSTRLKELRNEKGKKQSEMAELLNCTVSHYQKVEYGKVNLPSLSLAALADYFEVSTDYLLGRTDVREVCR